MMSQMAGRWECRSAQEVVEEPQEQRARAGKGGNWGRRRRRRATRLDPGSGCPAVSRPVPDATRSDELPPGLADFDLSKPKFPGQK